MALIPIPPSAPTRVMTGATAVADGKAGSVTKPVAGDHLKFLRGDGTFASVSAADRRNSTTSRANATAGVAPTVGEHASPIDGDTHTIILNNGNVEYYKYTTVWGLVATVVPVTFDGSHTPISRANALTNVPPTIGEVPSPVEGDSASVFLNDGTIENWYRNATVWALINTITPVTSDGNSTWISRANATTGVAPTVGEVSAPVSGDTAIVLLNNGTKEYWTRTTVWTLTATEAGAVKDGRVVWVSRANTTTGNAPTGVEFVSPVNGDSAIVILSNWTKEYWSYVLGAWALTTTEVVGANDGRTIWLPRADAVAAVAPTAGEVATPISGDAAMVILNNGVKEYWAYTTVWTLVATETPSASSADTIQTAATTGGTTITAWGSVVLIPTLTGNITLTYPTPVGNIGKTIKVIQTGTPNSFTVTHTPAVGAITLTNAAGEIATAGGAFEVEAIDATNIRQVSNSVVSGTAQILNVYSLTRTRNTPTQQLFTSTNPDPINLTAATVNINRGSFTTNLATGQITVGVAGDYSITFVAQADDTGGTASAFKAYVKVDGVLKGDSAVTATDTYEVNSTISTTIPLAAGSVLTFEGLTSDGEDMNLIGYDLAIVQLPNAVAPVTNTVAEYGNESMTLSVDANNNAGVWVDRPVSVTLPSAGVYRIRWNASAEIGSSATTQVVMAGRLYNTTTATAYSKTHGTICNNDNETAVQTNQVGCGTGEDIITVTGATVITFQTRINAVASAVVLLLGESAIYGRTYVSYEKIAGQLPSTGATVDYLSATSNTLTLSFATTPSTITTVPARSGNIPYNPTTGAITLTAGKTYKLSGSIIGNVVGDTNADVAIYFSATANGSTPLVTGSKGSAPPTTNNGPIFGNHRTESVYTPTVTQDVYFVISISGSTRNITGAEINVVQIGSTNTVGGNTNVDDQSSASYFDIGNMRMQFFTANVQNGTVVTLPRPFANTSYKVTASGTSVSAISYAATSGKTTTSFTAVAVQMTTGSAYTGGSANVDYIAIGQKP